MIQESSRFGEFSLRAVCLFGILFLAQPQQGDPPPPAIYIAKGACPFEGCAYREWIARRNLTLLDRPEGQKIVGQIRQGEHVRAITGEVHCVPIPVVASRDHPRPGSAWESTSPQISRGDTFYMLHYLGEAEWQVWFRGNVTVIEGQDADAPAPHATWWAEVKTASGVTGWVIAADNFDGQDMLGFRLASPSANQTAFQHLR